MQTNRSNNRRRKGSGTTTIPVTKDMIKPGTYNPNQTGNQTIKVIYGGKETSLTITVKDYVTGITINPASVTVCVCVFICYC